jgi:23S rRNA (adenine2503-C2)-methyltransferase
MSIERQMASQSNRPLITNLSRADLAEWCRARGDGPFRADQTRRWIFGKRVNSFDAMHDLPLAFRAALESEFRIFGSDVVSHLVAGDQTEKLLLRLEDGSHVECVLMREPDRSTVCLSTQVGCGMGCVFCASGLLGLKRNLSTGEILEQVLRLDRLMGPEERITNVVAMGIGEPLANLGALLPALDTLNEKGALGIGARRITISTVGLPEKIRELARHGKPYNLAVSLHAPDDELRNRLVPVNARIGIAAILEAADDYFRATGRRLTFEYVLLGGVNDSIDAARKVAALLAGRCAHVNLIPMNGVSELPYADPSPARISAFIEVVSQAGIAVTVRKRKGADIDAACGQLRLAAERQHADAPAM